MKVELTNTLARLIEYDQGDLQWIDHCLTFREKNRYTKQGDGVVAVEQPPVKLLNHRTLTFHAGLVGRVVDAGAKDGRAVEVLDVRERPSDPAEALAVLNAPDAAQRCTALLGGDVPYKHQLDAARAALTRTRGIIEIPTGGGKAHLITLLAQLYPARWLCCVPSRELLTQTAERYTRLTGKHAGKIGDGHWDPAEFTVATLQGLDAKLRTEDSEMVQWIHSVTAVAVDEVHSLTGPTFSWVVQRCRNAFLRFGFSATPCRGGHRDIYPIGCTGDLIYKVTPMQLHALGLVAAPRVRAITVVSNARVKSWQTAHEQLLVNGQARNLSIALRCKAALENGDMPGLVLVSKTEHGMRLQEAMASVGLSVPFVHGKTKKSQRKQVLAGLLSGTVELAIATDVWRTGVDIPNLRMTFHASGGMATVELLQGLGRGMRISPKHPDKTTFLALDVADQGCHWLDKHWRARRSEYAEAGYTLEVEGL